MENIQETDKAYYAGYLDGEGCIHVSKNKARPYRFQHHFVYYVEVTITNSHPETLYELRNLFGGFVHKYVAEELSVSGEPKLPRYTWKIVCTKAVKFLHLILPYVRQKKELAELVIQYQNEIGSKKFWRGQGVRLSQEEMASREAFYWRIRKLNRAPNKSHHQYHD